MFSSARNERGRVLIVAAGLVVSMTAASARADRTEPLPKQLEGIAITDHPGAQVPLDLEFKDETGKTVRLGDFITGRRPVILTLVYFQCPMLCGLVLQGVVEGLKALPWTPGKDFDLLTVSFNPRETPKLAMLKKETYVKAYGRPGAASWHFLTGQEPQIKKLADTVGFAYRWDPTTKQYVHATGIFVLTPDGKVARTLYGVVYEPKTLRLALTEAGKGTVGGAAEQLLLYCCRYDPNAGTYVVAAGNVMRLGGIATALIVGVWLGLAWIRGARRARSSGPGGTES
jgi:protein SCO1